MKNKLYRNTEEGMVAGVLAGFADYFGGDVTIWRLCFIFLLIVTGLAPLLITYIIAWIIVPKKPMFNAETVVHNV